jgi:phosphatidylserine decarboxylase
MMRLGTRVDIFLPRTAKVAVHVGDKVAGGQSVLARWE